ncbi:programmed cell death protein 2-like [Colias croceus]|uniref:programmed cell death protein 2-like n=1 Tax=Colias crocea TaxID=72248 RepID=UPI001E27E879|nr:programmed cell death protein 2-like [Colias croceus]
MAKKQGKVYLGYEEEIISDKNRTLLNFTVNKIGGLPDWPPIENLQYPSKCPICSLHRLLIVQCYAPLENSVYHRTLYIFACINTNCWNQSESWACIRCQVKDDPSKSSAVVAMPSADTNLSWCTGSDDWDENDNGDSANGNLMSVDNAVNPNIQRNSDDDESNSYDIEAVEQALGHMQVIDAHNANMSPMQGAVGDIGVPMPAAELEGGDEPGLVTAETPTAPTSNVEALLHQTAELPADLRNRLMLSPLQFLPRYIYVEEEWKKSACNDEKVNDLLNKYTKESEIEANINADRLGGGGDDEPYEEATPLHGDKLFHAFLTRLQNNPGQILRYSRDEPPLLGAPLPLIEGPGCRAPTVCMRCGSRLICELQLVPAFAENLQILPGNVSLSHLHFLSVLVFTCSQSCWQPNDTFVQETIVFQPEVI